MSVTAIKTGRELRDWALRAYSGETIVYGVADKRSHGTGRTPEGVLATARELYDEGLVTLFHRFDSDAEPEETPDGALRRWLLIAQRRQAPRRAA